MILNNFSGIETIRFHCIKHPFKKVEKEIGNIIFETLNKKWQKREIELDFSNTLSYYDGRTSFHEMVKCLIWQPQAIDFDLVVFLSSMTDGWPTLLNKYFSIHKRETICLGLSDKQTNFPFYNFEYRNNYNNRIVQAMKDDSKWEFFESGSLLPFEDEINYKKRKIFDRLNNDIINDYLLKNGIDICEDDFWKSKEMAVEFITKLQ
jgi:hypothetical protein